MSDRKLLRRSIFIVVIACVVSFLAVETTRHVLEQGYKGVISLEAQRRGYEITAQTLNGNIMGSAANLGLVNLAVKSVAAGTMKPDDPMILSTLKAIGDLYKATGVFVADLGGHVVASWDSTGKSSNGLDIAFRPYYRIALKGTQNVYAAVSLATGQRAMYFAAPIYSAVSLEAPVIGAAVARLNLERIDTVLGAWQGHAFLVSPQNIIFASSRPEWTGSLTRPATADELKAIKELKQFGARFDSGTPEVLPFDPAHSVVTIEGKRHAVAHAQVRWNDPAGDWDLVLMGDLDMVLGPDARLLLGLVTFLLALVIGLIYLVWRRRLDRANLSRKTAEADLSVYSRKLEVDSIIKSFLVDLSARLHNADSLGDFARVFFHDAIPRTGSDYGAFYVIATDTGRLIPAGAHGVSPDSLAELAPGEGLVGQCAKDRRPLAPDPATAPDLSIRWAGGRIRLHHVRLWPIDHMGNILGVLVLAGTRPPTAEADLLLDSLLPMMAMNLEILLRNLHTRSMLDASQGQTRLLAKQQDTINALINAIPDMIHYKSPDGVYMGCNRAYGNMLGLGPDQITGKTDHDILPGEVADWYRKDDLSILESGQARSQEEWVDLADGQHLLYDTVKTPFRDADGNLLGLLSISRDMTERYKAKEAMDSERSKLKEILDNSPLGVAILTKGCFRLFNPALARIMPAENGRPFNGSCVRPADWDSVEEQLKTSRILKDRELLVIQASDGKPRTVVLTAMRMDYGNEPGILVWLGDRYGCVDPDSD